MGRQRARGCGADGNADGNTTALECTGSLPNNRTGSVEAPCCTHSHEPAAPADQERPMARLRAERRSSLVLIGAFRPIR